MSNALHILTRRTEMEDCVFQLSAVNRNAAQSSVRRRFTDSRPAARLRNIVSVSDTLTASRHASSIGVNAAGDTEDTSSAIFCQRGYHTFNPP